ncbi:hypothetical protein PN36_34120 [Candidatus Thiomargarita nelsonii]|uniref:Uncharacterized protein n=1 Tax=Candidatus Thiomargarita nelsonii TaxID=1003181 RepID=A0A0A6PS57_9GAMM|nr:hypothetical protein PN36_34120 [Candidatus Thiomargarita nelsonii]
MAQDNDLTLIALWQKRDQLDEANQWTQLYHLITQVIKRGRYPQLASLPDSIDDYIQAFIVRKVFETAQGETMGGGQLYFANALITYFRNFLIDLLRMAERKNTEPLDDNQEDTNENASQFAWQKEVAKSAQDFLQNSEHWVRLYLALHTCSEGRQRLPLSKLATRYQIASHHYKAHG